MQYRRTPLDCGYSPSQLLNGRQLRCKIDTLLPSPVHLAQERQAKAAANSRATGESRRQERQAKAVANSQAKETNTTVGVVRVRVTDQYKVGQPCYAQVYSPRNDKDPKWAQATVTRVLGPRRIEVRVHPCGPIWRRHVEQLRPRYVSPDDDEPPQDLFAKAGQDTGAGEEEAQNAVPKPRKPRQPKPIPGPYSMDTPRRSSRTRVPNKKYY